MGFKQGVRYYSKGILQLEVAFPEGDVRCQWCPFCVAEKSLGRWWCKAKNWMVYDPYAPGLPDFCPIRLMDTFE